MSRPLSRERGSATVVTLAVIAVVLLLTISGLTLASAVLASHRARAAADLAALAAAGELIRGELPGTACERAARVATANHGQVQSCTAAGEEVTLSVTVPAGVQGLGVATARSRAGPALGGHVPGGFVPGGFVPGGHVPGGSVPGGSVPSGSVPSGSVPGGSVPDGPARHKTAAGGVPSG